MSRALALCIAFILLHGGLRAQVKPLAFSARVLKDSLFIPWEILYGPDNHIWFTQKNGYICRMDTAGKQVDTLYHEPLTVTIKESGMLGMVLHPAFASVPYVYVAWEYMDSPNFIRERIWRYTYSAATNTLSSPVIILDSINGYLFHNGCRMAIAGDKLFISVGDADDFNSGQSNDSINGKILRINLDGTVPADNPIPGSPIWSKGHRNPQGLVYANGILYSSEHGAETDDEVNIIKKGANYGWPYVRGFCDQPAETTFCNDSGVTTPMHTWTPTIAPCGIDYYHHSMFPWLQNSLLLTTLKDKHLYQLQLSDNYDEIISATVVEGIDYGRLRDICISPDGKIFLSTSNSAPNDTGKRIDKIIMVYNPGYKVPENVLLLYPNPATQYVYVSIPGNTGNLHFVLTSYSGKKISEGILAPGRPKIFVGELPQGLYSIALWADNGTAYHGRFVRQNQK